MRVPVCSALVFVAILINGCSSGRGQNQSAAVAPQTAIAVSTAKPEHRDLVNRLDLAGTITPYEQVTVYARVTGYVRSMKVDIGDYVRQGQLLAELDVPEITADLDEKRAALLQAESTIEQAQAAVEEARAEAEFARLTYGRLKAVRDQDAGVLAQQEVDQAWARYGVAQAKQKSAETQVKAAHASVAAAKAGIARLQALTSFARIDAPMSGAVTERFVDPGALVQAASSSRTQTAPLVSLARLDRLRVLVDVPEPVATKLHPGMAAAINLDALQGQEFPARVARTGRVLDAGSRTMRVELDVPNPAERLRPGMTAKVTLQLSRMQGAVTIPVAALRSEGSERKIFVVEGSTARQRSVKTGLESPEWVQIVEGLRGDEQVIIASAGPLTDGATVRLNP